MKILVTGGAGFIGSHLVAFFHKRGDDILVLDDLSTGKREYLPNGIQLIEKDITKADAFKDIPQVDFVFHLAAQVNARASVTEPIPDAEANIIGTIQLLEWMRQNGNPHLIFTSTCGVYGDSEELPVKESASCHPLSGYAASKFSAEQYIALYQRLHGLNATIFRFSNVYGPRQFRGMQSGVISIFAQLAKEGKTLTIFGDGKQTRDYLAVQDIIDAFEKVVEKKQAGVHVYNLGTGHPVDLLEVIQFIKTELGREVIVQFEPGKEGDILHSYLDAQKAKSEFNWEAKVLLQDGIRQLLG